MGTVRSQGVVKHLTEIVEASELFSSRELTDIIIRETGRYTEQFQLSFRLLARAWKHMKEE
jgi:hypothetical protein